MKLQREFFFLSPVEVVKVTSSNLNEVADWCGGEVNQVESRRVQGRMDSYVLVPTPKGTSTSWAFPGMFITKRLVLTVKSELKATFAVFRRDYFEKNYFETPQDAVNKTWELEAKQVLAASATAEAAEPVVEPALSTAQIEALDDIARERIEQVNEEILKGNIRVTKRGKGEVSREDVILNELTKGKPNAGITPTAKAIAEKVGQTPEFVQAVLDAPTEDLERAATVVKEQLGAVELPPGETIVHETIILNDHHPITGQVMDPRKDVSGPLKQPRLAMLNEDFSEVATPPEVVVPQEEPAEVVEAWVHNHDIAMGCDESECGTDRYLDGIHVFTDVAVATVEGADGYVDIDMPAAIAERKA